MISFFVVPGFHYYFHDGLPQTTQTLTSIHETLLRLRKSSGAE